MWKNLFGRMRLTVKSRYLVQGLNLDFFINTLKKQGISLFDVKKFGNKRLYLSVNFNERRKFFAIAKKMCYNVTKVGEKGRGKAILSAYRSFGVVLGCAIIAIISIFANRYIFSITYTGSGSVHARLANEYLSSCGVKPFTDVKDKDFSTIEDGLLSHLSGVSFVSVKKSGNRLIVDMALSSEKTERLKGDVFSFTAPTDCVVEQLKVYRGTAMVNVGDSVKSGDLLVDGFYQTEEQRIKINVLAVATLKCQKQFQFKGTKTGLNEQVCALAIENLGDKNVLETVVNEERLGNEFVYTVTVYYRQIIYVG